VWSNNSGASGSQNDKRACNACVLSKTRCHIQGEFHLLPFPFPFFSQLVKNNLGVFFLRRPRGKAAESCKSHPQENVDEMRLLFTELSERLTHLQEMRAADDETKQALLARIADLELQVKRLKAQVAKS
jgi:hypothetical protein